jgi:hypothetical protein
MLLMTPILVFALIMMVTVLSFTYYYAAKTKTMYDDEINYLQQVSKVIDEKHCSDFLVGDSVQKFTGIPNTNLNKNFRISLNCTTDKKSMFYQYNWAKNNKLTEYEDFVKNVYLNSREFRDQQFFDVKFVDLNGDKLSVSNCSNDYKQCMIQIEFIK